MSFSSPLARLPVDPVNNATSSKYYTYVSGGSWELSAVMEAVSNKLGGDNDRVSGDGGEYADIYETGTNLELLPVNRNPNLVGYWQFDEGTGTNTYDASGNGNDGTLVNTPTWTTDAKKGDYALEFNGENTYVDIGTDLGVFPNISVEAWVKYDDSMNRKAIIASDSPSVPAIFFEVNEDNLRIYRGGYSGSYTLQVNNWYHVVGIVEGIDGTKDMEIYVNGIRKVNSDNVSNSMGSDTGNMQIGIANGNLVPFNGTIDNVRIYNRALSATEIEAMYNSY